MTARSSLALSPDLYHGMRSSLLVVEGLLEAIKLVLQDCHVLCLLNLLLGQSILHFWPKLALHGEYQKVICQEELAVEHSNLHWLRGRAAVVDACSACRPI